MATYLNFFIILSILYKWLENVFLVLLKIIWYMKIIS